ncbi:MAG: ATP-binding cassette domain-containing protein, partial [Chloroflexota bacterium]
MASILSAQNVTKRFGGLVAVDHVNIEVEEKSIHAIIGPNGAGKTTFFNCLTGFYSIDEGRVMFQGKLMMDVPPDQITRRGVSRTYQNIRLFA